MQYFLAANLKLVIQHQSYQGQFIHGLLIDEVLCGGDLDFLSVPKQRKALCGAKR